MFNPQAQTKEDEGYRERVYLDSKGNPSGGWGHYDPTLRVGQHKSKYEWEYLFDQDWQNTEGDYTMLGLDLDEIRAGVVKMMLFNMGLPAVLKFKRFLMHLRAKNFRDAAFEMGVNKEQDGPSQWLLDVGHNRACRMISAMLTGFWA